MKVLNGPKYKQGWKLMLKNCRHSMKWKELAVNRTLLVMIKSQANTFFMIIQRKVLKAAEVFATTVKRWSQGKNINQKIALLIWPLPWALSFQRKNNIEICRNLEISIRKRLAGLKHLLISENSSAPSFVIAATTLFSCITTVRNLTMPLGRSVAC